MDYILDTNILLIYLRNKNISKNIDKKYQLLKYPNSSAISVVTVGELRSIAKRNKWGLRKTLNLQKFINHFLIADINIESIINSKILPIGWTKK